MNKKNDVLTFVLYLIIILIVVPLVLGAIIRNDQCLKLHEKLIIQEQVKELDKLFNETVDDLEIGEW